MVNFLRLVYLSQLQANVVADPAELDELLCALPKAATLARFKHVFTRDDLLSTCVLETIF